MNDLLSVFFSKSFETDINEKLQKLDYNLPKEQIKEYCRSIIFIELSDFFNWIDDHAFFTIDSSDMPQMSDFNDAFYNVVYKIIDAGDKGFRYIEIGKLLQDDGIERNDMANRKYGENHAKAAEYLGYLYSLRYHYYVSCLGYVLDDLTEDEKSKLFTRLFIRTNLFMAIYLLTKKSNLNFRSLFDVLSDKTYKRRLPGTKLIINSLNDSNEFNFKEITEKVNF